MWGFELLQEIIDYLRVASHNTTYSPTMSPPVVKQIKCAIACISGKDGTGEGEYWNAEWIASWAFEVNLKVLQRRPEEDQKVTLKLGVRSPKAVKSGLPRVRRQRLPCGALLLRRLGSIVRSMYWASHKYNKAWCKVYMGCRAISRILQDHGVSIVVVGYPAVPFYESRIRLCLSSDHTRTQLDRVS